jgi:hypothetical protein
VLYLLASSFAVRPASRKPDDYATLLGTPAVRIPVGSGYPFQQDEGIRLAREATTRRSLCVLFAHLYEPTAHGMAVRLFALYRRVCAIAIGLESFLSHVYLIEHFLFSAAKLPRRITGHSSF